MWVPGGLAVSASGKMSLHLPEEIREGLRGEFTLEQGLEDEKAFSGRIPHPQSSRHKGTVCMGEDGLLENCKWS